jgi:hypothetical protein
VRVKQRLIKSWSYANQVAPATTGFINNPVSLGRRFAAQDSHPLWSKAFSEFGLTPVSVEPVYKCFTGNHFIDGTFTHKHIDSAPEGLVHTRCNLMIKKPPIGGDPILDDEVMHVDEGDLWLCLASMEYHSSTPIQGGERIIFSFGGLVPKEQINNLLCITQNDSN